MKSIIRRLLMVSIAVLLNACRPVGSASVTLTPVPPDVGSASVTLTPVPPDVGSASVTLTPVPPDVVRFAWFYRPADNVSSKYLATHYQWFVLTRKDEPVKEVIETYGHSVVQYLRFEAIQAQDDCATVPYGNQAAYKSGDWCEISVNHLDFFNMVGDVREKTSKSFYRMDPASVDWQVFFTERANEMRVKFGWAGGLFLDNGTVGSDSGITEDDILGFFAYVRGHYPNPLYANLSGLPGAYDGVYDAYLDGVMHETFVLDGIGDYVSEAKWLTRLTRAESVQANGKMVVLVDKSSPIDQKKLTYSLASYLLIARGQAYWRFADVYQNAIRYPDVSGLGAPLGERFQMGTAWRRKFSGGSVTVDPSTHSAVIDTSP